MRQIQLLRWAGAGAGAGALLFCSCASVSVENVSSERRTEPSQRPQRILVEPFGIDGAEIKENAVGQKVFGKKRGRLGPAAQKLVAGYVAQELSKMGVPATVVPPRTRAGSGEWVVGGQFTRIEEGSRILRMGLGLGFGGTKMETLVQVRNDGAPAPFLRFNTTGGSNATPGAATNPIPFSAAPTALINSKEGVTDDAARTARMITAEIGEYMLKRGWIQAGQVPRKKVKGKWDPAMSRSR